MDTPFQRERTIPYVCERISSKTFTSKLFRIRFTEEGSYREFKEYMARTATCKGCNVVQGDTPTECYLFIKCSINHPHSPLVENVLKLRGFEEEYITGAYSIMRHTFRSKL